MSWNTIKIAGAEGRKSYFGDCYCWCCNWIAWLIEFLGDKMFYGHVLDPFPLCETGSGHRMECLGVIVRE